MDMVLNVIQHEFWCTAKDEKGTGKFDNINPDTMLDEKEIYEHGMRFRRSVIRSKKDTLDMLSEAVEDLMPLFETLQGVVTDNRIYHKHMRELASVGFDRDEQAVKSLMREVHHAHGRTHTVHYHTSKRGVGPTRALV